MNNKTAMTAQEPDTLQVTVTQERERAATGANVFVSVEGASLVTGEMALHKAREVAALVSSLAEVGISPADITLQGVRAETSAGKIVKVSAASYKLRICCEPLEKLADVVGVITSQKNAALSHMTWRYPNNNAERDTWMDGCLAEAGRKAWRMASALGVQLVGVYRCTEQYAEQSDGPEPRWIDQSPTADTLGIMRRVRVSPEELGLEVTHTKQVRLTVNVAYRVSGFAEDSSAHENQA